MKKNIISRWSKLYIRGFTILYNVKTQRYNSKILAGHIWTGICFRLSKMFSVFLWQYF